MTDVKTPPPLALNRGPYKINHAWKIFIPQNCRTLNYSNVYLCNRNAIYNLKYISLRERLKIFSFLGENIGTLPFLQRDTEGPAKVFPSHGNHNIFSLFSLRRNLGSSETISILPVSTHSFKIEVLPKKLAKWLWFKRKWRLTVISQRLVQDQSLWKSFS